MFYLKKEFTKSNLVLYLSFILVTWSLLQISLTDFFENNDNILMKISSIYAQGPLPPGGLPPIPGSPLPPGSPIPPGGGPTPPEDLPPLLGDLPPMEDLQSLLGDLPPHDGYHDYDDGEKEEKDEDIDDKDNR